MASMLRQASASVTASVAGAVEAPSARAALARVLSTVRLGSFRAGSTNQVDGKIIAGESVGQALAPRRAQTAISPQRHRGHRGTRSKQLISCCLRVPLCPLCLCGDTNPAPTPTAGHARILDAIERPGYDVFG